MLREFDPRTSSRPSEPERALCPFCLHRDDRLRFERRKHCICPKCGRKFYLSSLLTSDRTIRSYARFVVEYPMWFRTIDFSSWSAKLKELGIASEFWEAYREFKPKIEAQTRDDY